MDWRTLIRFEQYADRSAASTNACHPWREDRRNKAGYGMFSHGGNNRYAARLMLATKLGRALRDDEQTRHTCNNPPCVNWRHLLPGDGADQHGDRRDAGTDPSGEKNGRAKLTWPAVHSIRARYLTGEVTQDELAREHGVSQVAISQIVQHKTWLTGLEEFQAAAEEATSGLVRAQAEAREATTDLMRGVEAARQATRQLSQHDF